MLVTAIQDPKTGLEGKFSVNHAAAVALIDGAAGEKQFTDEAVRAPAAAALRRRVIPTVDPSIGKEQARVAIVLKNGERLTTFVEHAVGSLQKPLSDRGIEDKFRGLADGILPAARPTRSSTCAGAPTPSPTPATSPARQARFDGPQRAALSPRTRGEVFTCGPARALLPTRVIFVSIGSRAERTCTARYT